MKSTYSIAKKLLHDHELTPIDAARLILEVKEELGDSAPADREGLLVLIRRVIRAGVAAIRAEEHTVSFEEAAWASVEARQSRREATKADLRHFIRRMLRVEGVAARPLRGMGVAECRNLLEKAFPNSPSSYKKGRAILSSIFSYGIRHEWCDCNPVQAIETPRIKERPITPLTLEEVQRLERTAERPEHRAMQLSLKLMLYCGIRPTEVTRIDPQRDIIGDELIIRPNTSKTGGGRIIPLRKVAPYIRRHPNALTIPDHWEQRWRALRRAARFPRWQPDACRHTFDTYHARHFRNLPVLQLEMGHTTPRLLYSRYVSPIPQSVAKRFWHSTM